jgi:hypothetical protein
MSTIPKEIKDKINDACIEHSCFIAARESYAFGAEFGYQLATDGRVELEKENERLRDAIIGIKKSFNEQEPIILQASERMSDQITSLQSSLKEKDQEIERLNVIIRQFQSASNPDPVPVPIP